MPTIHKSYTKHKATMAAAAANVSKVTWKTMLFVEKTIQKNDGHIFGGYVRDKIIHDFHADIFYSHFAKDLSVTTAQVQKYYDDPTFLPDHNYRTCVPFDIDCFMSTENMFAFVKDVQAGCYTTKVTKSQKANFYFLKDDKALNKLTHTKLTIRPRIPKALQSEFDVMAYTVHVDIIHCDENRFDIFEHLTDHVDFECNGMIISPQNDYRLAMAVGKHLTPVQKLGKMQDIIEDIINMNAKPVTNDMQIPNHRFDKMLAKGWLLELPPVTLYKSKDKYEGHCIICHEDILKNTIAVKDASCDAHYHPKCFLEMTAYPSFHNECPMCKGNCCVTNEVLCLIRHIELLQN